MTIEQQVAELNENVGNLVSRSEILTDKIDDKLGEYEDKFQELQAWKDTIQKSSPITLEVGSGKEFAHPVDAANHINSSSLTGENRWIIKIDPGVYEFPHNGVSNLRFSYYKHVEINGTSSNADDVTFKYVGTSHTYLIMGEKHSNIYVRSISFKGPNPVTNSFISQILDKTLEAGEVGGGYVSGILCSTSSYSYVNNCNFNDIWYTIYATDNSLMHVYNINAENLYTGLIASTNSRIYINNSSFKGSDINLEEKYVSNAGIRARHLSNIWGYGIEIKGFAVGVRSEWGSNCHLGQRSYIDSNGEEASKNFLIENCHYGALFSNNSVGDVNSILIKNMTSYGIYAVDCSNLRADGDVTVDGALVGYFAHHMSSINANGTTVKNCGTGYLSTYKSEVYAAGTISNVLGNDLDHSPSVDRTLGNYDSYMYVS
jgi:hypothetical protein